VIPGATTREAAKLASIAVRRFLGRVPRKELRNILKTLRQRLQLSLDRMAGEPKKRLQAILKRVRSPKQRVMPKGLLPWLLGTLGFWGLELWLTKNHGPPAGPADARLRRVLAREWLAHEPAAERNALLEAALRFALAQSTAADQQRLAKSFEKFRKEKEKKMAANFYVDIRGLPARFFEDDPVLKKKPAVYFDEKVSELLEKSYNSPKAANENLHAAIKGMLLLDGYINPDAAGFRDAVGRIWAETRDTTKKTDRTTEVFNTEMYKKVEDTILAIRKGNNDISYQELASVSRYVIERAKDPNSSTFVPIDHPNFESQVRVGLDRYIGGPSALESLELPPLTGEEGQEGEIIEENVRSVAMIYASQQLERMRLFHVVDKMTESFIHGMLPTGFDQGGKLLDRYYWDREDRLSDGERMAHYGRVLGSSGADIPKDVPANLQFENRFLRFISSLAEYDRQRRLGDLLDGAGRALSLTGESVRNSGRALGSNASAFGWGGTPFAARRMNAHIQQALEILKDPNIQKVYGVTNLYAVIERVASSEFGQSPNIVKYRTMAESGKAILNFIAKYARVWTKTGLKPLFEETDRLGRAIPGDIPAVDRDEMMRHAQYILAVNGIVDDQVSKLSQPVETTAEPSVPVFPGGGSVPSGMNGGLDQLRQMVAAGSAPSLDQLKQLIPGLK
jgi:hypothetical protein